MNPKKRKEFEMQPLNQELYSDLSIEELEQRLETKPWICGAHVDCPNLECGVDNTPEEIEEDNGDSGGSGGGEQ